MLPFQAVEVALLVHARRLAVGVGGKAGEVIGVGPPHRHPVGTRRQLLEGVLADRLEHPEPGLTALAGRLPEEALVDERSQSVEDVHFERVVEVADGLGIVDRATADEHAQSREQRSLLGSQEVEAPVDRPTEGSLSFREVPSAARQRREAPVEAGEDRVGGEELDPGGRQLDRQRQPVEACADPGHGGRVLLDEDKGRAHCLGALDEQGHCVKGRQGGQVRQRPGIGSPQRCARRTPARRAGAGSPGSLRGSPSSEQSRAGCQPRPPRR